MTIQKVNEDISIGCEVWSKGGRWGHEAKLFYKGNEVESVRARYYNRTWEAYQFDSVKSGLMNKLDESKSLSLSERRAIALAINCNY